MPDALPRDFNRINVLQYFVLFTHKAARGAADGSRNDSAGPTCLDHKLRKVVAPCLGLGVGANLLFGGSGRTIARQPLSLQGQVGANLALGLLKLELRSAS